MSISDEIVVMKLGVLQQIGKPQDVYNDPVNLFVAQFLGTPAINTFTGEVINEKIYIGEEAVLPAPGVPNQNVWVGIRPEGFVLDENGPFTLDLTRVEIMGRDTSVVATHPFAQSPSVRAIISSENEVDADAARIRFSLKPKKVFIFEAESELRIRF